MADTLRPAAAARPEVVVLSDADEIAHAAAERLVRALDEAISARGVAHVALTGGSSAVPLYRELADDWRSSIDWGRVHLWWGDERLVPADHPESNVGIAYSLLLHGGARGGESGQGVLGTDVQTGEVPGLPIPADNLHPPRVPEAMAAEADAGEALAADYAARLSALLPTVDGLPAFDVILLGVGSDGHILSAFPGSAPLEPDAPLAVAVPAPEHIGPRIARVSLNPTLLDAARTVLVMVAGDDKAEIVARALDPYDTSESRDLPARLAARGNAVWLLDRAAASRLRPA